MCLTCKLLEMPNTLSSTCIFALHMYAQPHSIPMLNSVFLIRFLVVVASHLFSLRCCLNKGVGFKKIPINYSENLGTAINEKIFTESMHLLEKFTKSKKAQCALAKKPRERSN